MNYTFKHFARASVLLSLALLTFGLVLSQQAHGQSIPGSLTNTYTSTTHFAGAGGRCETVVNVYTWTFTDPAGNPHSFPETTATNTQISGCSGQEETTVDEWSNDRMYYLEASGSSGAITQVGGYINPKYLVVGVVYAPPGVSSKVSYSTSSTFSSTSNVSSMFGTSSSVSVKISGSTGLPAVFHATVTGTTTTTASQNSTSTSSTTVTFGQTVQTTFTGTPGFNTPVDHDYDSILIWLNPVTFLTILPSQPGQLNFTGYGYDAADTNIQGPDILAVPVGCLNGDFLPANCSQFAGELSRSWATGQIFGTGQVPGLTATDYAQILAVDPFTNPNYVFSPTPSYPNTTTDGRFTLSGGQSGTFDYFTYFQAQPQQQPAQTTFTNSYTDTNSVGQSATTQYSQAFGIDSSFSGGSFLSGITVDINTTQTLTWQNTAGTTVTSSNTQTDQATIVNPTCNGNSFCAPAYTGPLQWNVYQDNIYGTFEFQP